MTVTVYTNYIGRYTTRIFVPGKGDVFQCNGTELDMEGRKLLLSYWAQGYEIVYE